MKRFLLASVAFIFAFSGIVFAYSINGEYKGKPIVLVTHNGVKVDSSVPAYIEDGRTMVPLGVLRDMDLVVEWNNTTKTANVVTETKPVFPAKTPLTLEQIKALKDRIALIRVYDDSGKQIGTGTGFVINSKGLTVTAAHVARYNGQFHSLKVELSGKSYAIGKGSNAFYDDNKDVYGFYLPTNETVKYLKISDIVPKVKDKVYALGYPDGEFIVQQSEVYFLARDNVFDNQEKDGGISGGPLLNDSGEVIGLVIRGDSIGESVSVTTISKLYQDSFNQ